MHYTLWNQDLQCYFYSWIYVVFGILHDEEEMISAINNFIPHISVTHHSRQTLKKIKSIVMTAIYVTSAYLSGIILTISVISTSILIAQMRY